MTYAEKSIAVARSWIGTPYRHQATRKGAGCDCLGLLRGVWRDLYGAEPESIPFYTRDWAEPQGEEALWRAARRWLVERPLASEAVGDVLLFRMRDGSIAKHLGMQSFTGRDARFVHAYERHGVVESPLSEPWRRRIVARFAFPEETS